MSPGWACRLASDGKWALVDRARGDGACPIFTADFSPQGLVQRLGIVGRENAHQQVVRSRPLPAEMSQLAAGESVAPDVCEQKRPGKRPAHSAGVVPKMKLP